MTEVKHTSLAAHLKEADSFSQIYLIYGEPFFYKQAFDMLISAIVPEDKKAFNLEIIDGTPENTFDAIERASTFSLDANSRVIGFCDSHIFYAREDKARLIGAIKTAIADNNILTHQKKTLTGWTRSCNTAKIKKSPPAPAAAVLWRHCSARLKKVLPRVTTLSSPQT